MRAEREGEQPRELAQESRGVGASLPATAIQADGYPAGAGEGDAGEGMEADQG